MDWLDKLRESQEILAERLELCLIRLPEILQEDEVSTPYDGYFKVMTTFILNAAKLWDVWQPELEDHEQLKTLQLLNKEIYEWVDDDHYDDGYANPVYAENMLGSAYGKLLSILCSELIALPIYIQQERYEETVILLELYLEIYGMFAFEAQPDPNQIHKSIYWYISDYCDMILEYQMRMEVLPENHYLMRLVMESDTDKQLYLYRYGYYISTKEKFLQSHIAFESEDAIAARAETLVLNYMAAYPEAKEGTYVKLLFEVGCERLVRHVIEALHVRGLKALISENSSHLLMRQQPDAFSMIPEFCEQYLEDHWQDLNVFLNKALMEHRKNTYKLVSEKYTEDQQKIHGVIECTYDLL